MSTLDLNDADGVRQAAAAIAGRTGALPAALDGMLVAQQVSGGTEVVLTQTNQNDAEPLTPENRQEYAKNWTMVLDGLKKAVEESLPRSGAASAQQPRR